MAIEPVEFDRSRGIGGSDVPAILGVSPYATRTDVWMEKTRHPAWRPKAVTPEMRFGTLLEPVLRAAYMEDTGLRVFEQPKDKVLWADEIRFAHIDGLIEAEGIWEAKCPFQTWRNWHDGPPAYVLAQIQHYMDITGEPFCDVTALAAGLDPIFQTFRVRADPDAQRDIRTAVLRFWDQHVITGEPPDALPIEVRYPTHESDLMVVADDEAEALVQQMFAERSDGKVSAALDETLKRELQEKIGTAAGMIGAGWRIRFKKNRDSEKVAWQQVAAAYRKIIEEAAPHLDALAATDEDPDVQQVLTAISQADTLVGLYTTVTPGARPFVLEPWEPKEER